jgi:hypothetical protein
VNVDATVIVDALVLVLASRERFRTERTIRMDGAERN